MYNAKTIDHFFSYRHFYFTVAFFYFQYFNTQPLAEQIVFHHVGNYGIGKFILFTHGLIL